MADLTKTLELKVETSQAQKQISDVIEEIKNPVELKIDADVKEAVSSIKELQNIFKALTNQTKDGQTLRINVNGIVNVQKQLSKLSDTLTEVSNKISFDNIRPPKAVEANIDVVNKQLEVVKQNADAIKKAEKYLAGPKVENLMTEMMANDGKKDINFDDLGAKNYIKRAKQLVNLGGDLSKISFNLEWFTTDENKKSIKHSGIFTALDVLEKLQAVGGFKLQDIIDTSNGNVIGTDIDNLTSKLKDLDYELQQAKAKQGREFTVGLDESSIEKITQAVEKLNAVIGDTDGKTLGIDEASLTKIVSAIESIKESFNGIKFDESATLGFKPDQIDAITNSFRDLQDVLEDIHSLLSSLDIPKIDGSNITTERRPRRENRQTKTVSKTVPTADGGTRTVTNTKDNSVTTGGTKGIQIDPDVTEFVKKIQEQINGEHVEIDVEPKPISGFADKIKQAVGNVEIEITPVVGQKDININASLKDLMSRMNAYMQNNDVKGSYSYWKYLSDNFATLDSQTKQLVSDLGLLNETGNGIKLIDNGGNNQGGIIGEQNVLLSRNATEDKYNALLRLKGLLDQATEAGVQCSNILDITFDKNTGKMFELQKTLSGDPISNLGLVGDGKKAKFNTAVFEATDKQIQKLIKDIEILSKLGIGIDFNDSNFLFDKKNGFSFIDLDLLPEGFSSDYWKEELVPMFDYISDEFNNPELTKQIEQFKTRLQNAINSPTSAENEYTVEIHADTSKLRGEIESSLEASFEAKIEPDTSILRQNIEQDLTTPFKIEIYPSDTLVDTINKMLNISFDGNSVTNINDLTEGISRLVDKMKELNESDFSNTPLSSINDLLQNAEQLKDLAKILESSTEKIKAAKTKQAETTQAYDDTEMKRRAGEIQKKVDKTVDGADKEALVSIERMYDSHNNLVQAILTTKKKVQDSKTGKELDQIEKFNIHWNKAGNDVWASRMTKDEYDKSQKEYERYLKEQMSVYERLTKEQARRQNSGSDLTQAETEQLERAKAIINEINELKKQGLELTGAQEAAVARVAAADQKAEQIRQDFVKKQQEKDKEKQDRNAEKDTQTTTKDQLNEYFETIKKAEDALTRLNEALANSYNGNTTIDDVRALREEVKVTGDAAQDAKKNIEELLDSDSSGLTDREVSNYRKRLDTQYNTSLIGSDSSIRKLQKAQRKQFEDETKNDLYDYLNSRQTYQKLYSKSLGGQNTYDDNGRLVSSSALSSDEILQINNALTTIVAQEQNWNSAKVQGITLTQKQAEAVKLLRDASQQMNEDGSFNDNYTKDMLEQSAMQQKAMAEYSKLEKQITKMYDQTDWRTEGWEANVDSLAESLKNIGTTIGDIGSEKDLNKVLEKLKALSAQRIEMSKNTDWMPIADDTKASLKTGLLKWMDQNKRAANEYHEELQQILDDIDKIESKGDAEQISSRIQGVQGKAIEEGFDGKSLGDRFRDQFSNTMTSLATYYLSFQDFIRYGRQAISVVRELDTALTEVRKVSSESLGSLRDWQVSTFDQANTVGGSAKQLQESTASWLRLGKSFEESQEAAQASVKLLNVSEFTNIDDATTSLVSMKQAFKDLTYDDFIDKLNGVGDNFSSSTDQLAYGMQNVSSVLKVSGNDIDQSLALLTAANDVTQDMSKASMGVRTIALRMSGTEEAKQELEEMGEDTSDFIVQTQSKVDEQVRKYTATAANPEGISVLDDNGRLRSTYDVLLDISKVYGEIVEKDNEYGTNTSNALLELLAGEHFAGQNEKSF